MKKISQARKANLVFPVGRIGRHMRKNNPKHRISKTLPVYLTAVLEYLCGNVLIFNVEVMELAGNAARHHKRVRITPRHLFLAIANDEELHNLLKNVTIPQGGVIPRLLPQLLPKQKKKSIIIQQSSSSTSQVCSPRTNVQTSKKATSKSSVKKPFTKRKATSKQRTRDSPDPNKLMPGVFVLLEKKLFLGQKLTIIQGDLLKVTADAIINPTDSDFYMGGQIGQMLQNAGGEEFKQMIAQLKAENGPLQPFDAVLSPSKNICAKFVIHCNGPTSKDGNATSKLEKTMQKCLNIADSKGLKSLAFPLVGTGRGGLSKELAAEVLLKSVADYFMSVMHTSLIQLYFVLHDAESVKIVLKELEKM